MADDPTFLRIILSRKHDRDAVIDRVDPSLLSDRDAFKSMAEEDNLNLDLELRRGIVGDMVDHALRNKLRKAARKGVQDAGGQDFISRIGAALIEAVMVELAFDKTKAELEKASVATLAQEATSFFNDQRENLYKDLIAITLRERGVDVTDARIEKVFAALDAQSVTVDDADFAGKALEALGDGTPYRRSRLTASLSPADVTAMMATVASLKAATAASIAKTLNGDGVTDPMQVQTEAIRAALPMTVFHRLRTVAKNAISSNGGAPHLAVYGYDLLAGAALFEALATEAKPAELAESTVRARVEEFFRLNAVGLYSDRIAKVFTSRGIDVDADIIAAAYELMSDRRIPLNDPDFSEKLLNIVPELRVFAAYEPLFSENRDNGPSTPLADFEAPLPSGLKRSAISLLERARIDPNTQDNDWARAALLLAGSGFGFGGGTGGGAFGGGLGALASPPGLPPVHIRRFEDEFTAGIDGNRIRTMADAYYIHQFDRLGIMDMVEELAAKQRDFTLDLGNSAANQLLSHYRQTFRIVYPAAEDRRRSLGMVFDDGRRGEAFRNLMGAWVEAGIDLARITNVGDLVTSEYTRSSAYSRTRFTRAALNMQRFLSDVGGYHMPDLVERCGHQLHFCFTILERPEIQQYWGGRFNSGLWAVVEGMLNQAIGDDSEDRRRVYGTQLTDRARTLAVYGYDAFSWLADNASTIETVPDGELDRGLQSIQNWLAAYRRPDALGDWIDDDAFYGDEDEDMDTGDEYAEAAVEDALNDADML